jgi:PAS domain S-box-containing protein
MSSTRLDERLAFSDGLLQSEDAGLLAFDTECRYLFWNAVMERITGMTAAEMLGKRASEVFPFIEQTGEGVYFERALAGENAVSKNRRYSIAERGREGYFNGYYSPLRDGDGRIVGGVAVIRDITEQRVAEERLHETEHRFKNMADVAPVLLWMSGTDSLCTFFNQTWLDFTGRTLEEGVGVGWAEGIHFEDSAMHGHLCGAFNSRELFEWSTASAGMTANTAGSSTGARLGMGRAAASRVTSGRASTSPTESVWRPNPSRPCATATTFFRLPRTGAEHHSPRCVSKSRPSAQHYAPPRHRALERTARPKRGSGRHANDAAGRTGREPSRRLASGERANGDRDE